MIFDAFLSRQDGPGCLTAALGGLELRAQTALAGVRTAESSGCDLGNLVAALTKAGKLKLVAQNLSQEERRALLEEAASKGSADIDLPPEESHAPSEPVVLPSCQYAPQSSSFS